MPYDQGVRISQEEYVRRKQAREGREQQYLHTGPNGENPAPAPELDPETQAPKVKPSGSKRSKANKASAKAAIADATGVSPDSPTLADIDASGLDEGGEES